MEKIDQLYIFYLKSADLMGGEDSVFLDFELEIS